MKVPSATSRAMACAAALSANVASSLNHMCDLHIRLQSYWTGHNPRKKLNDWLDGLANVEIEEEALRKAPIRGKHWHEVDMPSGEE